MLRQWMVTHEWMVKPMPQTEWIEKRGVLVWITEVFTSLGAGLYLVSLFYSNWWGMLVAWFIIMFLKVPLHLIFFGKPFRFWRTIPPFSKAWKTSWFTRGITFSVVFGSIVFVQLIITYFAVNVFPGTAWGIWDIALRALGGIFAFLVGIYSGFIMSFCRSVPFWNSALLPLVFIFAGIADGFALVIATGLFGAQVNIMTAEAGSRVVLLVNALIITTYLWNATYTSSTAKESVIELVRGDISLSFWAGVVGLGILIPLVISAASYFAGEASAPLLIGAIACHTAGAFALKYSLLKAGIHRPIFPATSAFK